MSDYYVMRNIGGAVFVKEGAFFEQQGGLIQDWGKRWKKIDADSIEDARAKGEATLPPYGAAAPVSEQPSDPMDWPLPCDVTVGAGTIKKGVALRVLVKRMEVLHQMAMSEQDGNARDAAYDIVQWLRQNANAEKDPKARAAFIEAHNAALKIKNDAAMAQQPGKEGA